MELLKGLGNVENSIPECEVGEVWLNFGMSGRRIAYISPIKFGNSEWNSFQFENNTYGDKRTLEFAVWICTLQSRFAEEHEI